MFISEQYKHIFNQKCWIQILNNENVSILLNKKASQVPLQSDKEQIQTQLQYFWMVETIYFQPQRSDDELIIFVVKTKDWFKGGLLIPAQPNEKKVGGVHTLNLVDLDNWTDNFADTLQFVNTLPTGKPQLRGSHSYTINVTCWTPTQRGSFFTKGPIPNNETHNELWLSLLASIKFFSKLYNDDYVTEYTQYSNAFIST